MALPFVFGPPTATADGADLDNNFNAVGLLGTIPCAVVGTNALTLTPSGLVAGTPPITTLQTQLRFSGIAVASNTGGVTANCAATDDLVVYKDTPSGPAALTGGEIVLDNLFVLTYDPTLNSGAGGYHLSNQTTTAAGTVTGVVAGQGLAGGTISTLGTISIAGIANNTLLANLSGATNAPTASAISAIFDSVFGSSQGNVIARGSSVWGASTETTFAPVVTFGGTSTSITLATQQGFYMQTGYLVIAAYNVVLAGKGSASTGNVAISLPVPAGGGGRVGGGLVTSFVSLSSVTSALWNYVGPSASVASILYAAGGTTAAIADTNMQNSTALAGIVLYFSG